MNCTINSARNFFSGLQAVISQIFPAQLAAAVRRSNLDRPLILPMLWSFGLENILMEKALEFVPRHARMGHSKKNSTDPLSAVACCCRLRGKWGARRKSRLGGDEFPHSCAVTCEEGQRSPDVSVVALSVV